MSNLIDSKLRHLTNNLISSTPFNEVSISSLSGTTTQSTVTQLRDNIVVDQRSRLRSSNNHARTLKCTVSKDVIPKHTQTVFTESPESHDIESETDDIVNESSWKPRIIKSCCPEHDNVLISTHDTDILCDSHSHPLTLHLPNTDQEGKLINLYLYDKTGHQINIQSNNNNVATIYLDPPRNNYKKDSPIKRCTLKRRRNKWVLVE